MKKAACIDQNVCAACGVCTNACLSGGISIYRGCYAVVCAANCAGCGLCAKVFPAGCITVKEKEKL